MNVLNGTEATQRFRSARSSRGSETPIYNRTPYWILFFHSATERLKRIYVVCLGKNTRVRQNFHPRLKPWISLSSMPKEEIRYPTVCSSYFEMTIFVVVVVAAAALCVCVCLWVFLFFCFFFFFQNKKIFTIQFHWSWRQVVSGFLIDLGHEFQIYCPPIR